MQIVTKDRLMMFQALLNAKGLEAVDVGNLTHIVQDGKLMCRPDIAAGPSTRFSVAGFGRTLAVCEHCMTAALKMPRPQWSKNLSDAFHRALNPNPAGTARPTTQEDE